MSSAMPFLFVVLVYWHSTFVNSVLKPAVLYSFAWNSSLSSIPTYSIDIYEIELKYNNEIVDSSLYTLTTSGLSSPVYLTDGDYTSAAYSSSTTEIYILFNFTDIDGQGVATVLLITNCADGNPSDFCSATKLIFDVQNAEMLTAPIDLEARGDRVSVVLFTFEDDCDINTLIYHQSYTKEARKDIFTNTTDNECYDIVCKECLLTMIIDNEDIEFSYNTNVYFSGYSSESTCTCPSYNTKILEDNIVTVYDSNDDVIGELKTSNYEYVLFQLVYWPLNDPSQSTSINCDLYYWPDSDDYLSVPSQQLITLEFEFNGPSNLMDNAALKSSFDYAFTEYFETLFNLSFVDIATVYKTINGVSYKISFDSSTTSTEPLMQVDTMLVANTTISSGAVTVIADHFVVDESEITEFSIADAIYSNYDGYNSTDCASNWLYVSTTTVVSSSSSNANEDDISIVIGIGLGALLITILISAGIIYKLKKEEKWCFVGHYVHRQSKQLPKPDCNQNNDNDGREGVRDSSDIYLTERASNMQNRDLMPRTKNDYSYPKQIQRLDTEAYASKRILENIPPNESANYQAISSNNPQYMGAQKFVSQRMLRNVGDEGLVDRRPSNTNKDSVYFTSSVGMSDNNSSVTNINAAHAKLDANLMAVVRDRRVYEFKNFKKELTLVRQIGKGSFGTVYKAKWEANDVAVKLFHGVNQNMTVDTNAPVMIDDEFAKELHAEIISASKVPPHPNIVKIMGFCRMPLCIVLEYMAGGSVQQLVYGLTKRPEPTVIEKLIILKKSCAGLKALTKCDLHHRDIAARNILLGHFERYISDYTQVKITDFGMTREDDKKSNNNTEPQTNSDTGPLKWMAPESIQDRTYNEKTDVYMWAVTMWEIMFGKEPYPNENAVAVAMMVCMMNKRPDFYWNLPDRLRPLIQKCWSVKPEDRHTFDEILQKLHVIHDNHKKDVKEHQEMAKPDENSDSATSG